jgi:phage recombination protein Bet
MGNAVATQQKQTISGKLAQRFNVDEAQLMTTLKATAFKTKDGVSDAQMTALMIVADQYGLNPFTKELFAFPDRNNGIVPVVSVDGWSRIINDNPALNGVEFRYAEKMVKLRNAKECPEWCEVIIHRKDRAQPTVVREYLDEVFRDLNYTNPWQTHTKRFLRHKALIQGARIAFGFGGIYDEDEAHRIIEMDVTPATPTGGVLSSLPVKVQTVIIETATRTKELLKADNLDDAYAMWQNSNFDADQQVAFWSLLDSKQRGVLDRMAQAEKGGNVVDAEIVEPTETVEPAAQNAAPPPSPVASSPAGVVAEAAPSVISQAQHKRLEARINEVGIARDKVKRYVKKQWGVEHLNEITQDQYIVIDGMLDNYVPPAQKQDDGGLSTMKDDTL